MIGYIKEKETIYVVFRGTQSTRDWVVDLHFGKVEYICNECEVHRGFYEAEQSVIYDVIKGVDDLKSMFPSFKVVVTGHSLGAALSTLTAVDLMRSGINVQLFNFGSPRIFNSIGAYIVSSLLSDIVRVSHTKDIVPHVPPMEMDYQHVSGEWYENEIGDIVKCCGYENSSCSDQWKAGLNGDDHMWYLGMYVGCPL
jgi:hypothetical protein